MLRWYFLNNSVADSSLAYNCQITQIIICHWNRLHPHCTLSQTAENLVPFEICLVIYNSWTALKLVLLKIGSNISQESSLNSLIFSNIVRQSLWNDLEDRLTCNRRSITSGTELAQGCPSEESDRHWMPGSHPAHAQCQSKYISTVCKHFFLLSLISAS